MQNVSARTPAPELSSQTTSNHSANNFDFLRFLFAAIVIFSHSFALCGVGKSEPLSVLSGGQTYTAEIAVDGFFVISGFLITASWRRRPQWSEYLQKRVLRIYPGFLVVCLLCAFLVGPIGAVSPPAYFQQFQIGSFLRHLVLLDKLTLPPTFSQNFAPNEVNGSLWTIKIEFEFYLITALLGTFGLFRRRVLVLAFAAACLLLETAVSLPFVSVTLPDTLTSHLRFLTYFLAGMACFLYRDKIAYNRAGVAAAVVVLGIGAATHAFGAVMALPVVYLLLAAAFSPTVRLHRFAQTQDISYGLYLYAWPIQQLLVQHFDGLHNPWSLFLTALPLTALAATLSWHLIEKPCLRFKPNSLSRGKRAVRAEEKLPAHRAGVALEGADDI